MITLTILIILVTSIIILGLVWPYPMRWLAALIVDILLIVCWIFVYSERSKKKKK